MDKGVVNSHTELAEHLGLVRSRVSTVLNLLNLDQEIKDYLLELDESDPKIGVLNERKLRPLALLGKVEEQKEIFWRIVKR